MPNEHNCTDCGFRSGRLCTHNGYCHSWHAWKPQEKGYVLYKEDEHLDS